MSRAFRWVVNLVAAVSAGLCVALAVLWVRSFEPPVWRLTMAQGSFLWLWVDANTIGPFLSEAFDKAPEHSTVWVYRHLESTGTITASREMFGCKFQSGTADANEFNPQSASPFSFWLVQVPIWPFIAATAVLPLIRLLALRRKNTARDMCKSCGYDLRATPERCPECGTVPAAKAAK